MLEHTSPRSNSRSFYYFYSFPPENRKHRIWHRMSNQLIWFSFNFKKIAAIFELSNWTTTSAKNLILSTLTTCAGNGLKDFIDCAVTTGGTREMSGARAVTLALATLVICINGFSPSRSFHKQHGKSANHCRRNWWIGAMPAPLIAHRLTTTRLCDGENKISW